MQNQRVLVTGGAGFIGSNLATQNDIIAVDDQYLSNPTTLMTTSSRQ